MIRTRDQSKLDIHVGYIIAIAGFIGTFTEHFAAGACGTVRNKLKFVRDSPVSSDSEDSQQPVYERPPEKYSAE